jgi:glycosyltransferase involved in cell wall biosynthesis
MAAGLPVVASDMPAMAELVRDTAAGVIVDAADPASVEAGLRAALEPARNAELRAAARAAAATITWDSERTLLARAYDDAMAGAP